ncbi:MAG: acyl-CoA dehydrogenase, partial [bacterium]
SATLAVTNAAGSWALGDTDVIAESSAGETRLRGRACFVQDARKASLFLVSAKSSAGLGLYCVDAGAPGVSIQPDRILDLSRDQARVTFDGASVSAASTVAEPGTGARTLARAEPSLLATLSADICGAAEWQLQTTVEYARVRVQFDRPLGFFQAVKHPLANMMVDIDRARSLVYAAASAIDNESEDALRLARMAKSAASDAAAFCSSRSIQLHGGIGFTWEHAAHIYFKRQKHSQALFGDGVHQRTELARLLAA